MNDFNEAPAPKHTRVTRVWVLAALGGVLVACVIARPSAPAASPASTPAAAPLPPIALSAPLPAPPSATAATQAATLAATTHSEPAVAEAQTLPELPRGGRTLFPDYRLVGFCGTPGAPELGELQGNLPAKAKALEAQAARYANARDADDRKLLPAFELIAVVVQGYPGPDKKYRRRVDGTVIEQYLRLARNSKGILLLNIQPGQSDFVTEVKALEKYLHEPDVGLALDPEWAMRPNQLPGRSFGQTTGAVISEVAEILSNIVQADKLPEKPLVFHQVNNWVLKDEPMIKALPGVVIIKSVDGLGKVGSKIKTYDYLTKDMGDEVHAGFKLFFDEDTRNGSRLMTPKEVLGLTPKPEYVMYE
jgi:hypothetical protein